MRYLYTHITQKNTRKTNKMTDKQQQNERKRKTSAI
jgi:hypothetical protein